METPKEKAIELYNKFRNANSTMATTLIGGFFI